MALRLIEMVLLEKDARSICALLEERKILECRQIRLPNEEVLIRILLDAKQNEAILDLLEKQFSIGKSYRAVILPVEATLPRPTESAVAFGKLGRIDRDELYEDIKDAAQCSRVYLAMVILSTIVVAIGLRVNSVPTIIGAMMIAPMLGPSMALGLGTTLGDLSLLRHASFTGFIGVTMTAVISVIIGILIHVNPTLTEIVLRTRVEPNEIAIALASGCAGALAFTTGASAILIGVMVAVALLPPLATFGLLLGERHVMLALGALSLFLVNLICVNISSIITFLVQGIHPLSWWERKRAFKATCIAICLWVGMLLALIALILLLRSM